TSQVSTHYLADVTTFMSRDCNKPGIDSVILAKFADRFVVNIFLTPSNLLFYGLADMDSGRFLRSSERPLLEVTLNGSDDPIFEKLSGLLSTSIEHVSIHGSDITPEYFSMLRGSMIRHLSIEFCSVNDTIASSVIELASSATEISLGLLNAELSDQGGF
ncbi:hypothetical protein PMAYCL1PPCAC_26479, partial [Pristionchus mayeri]